MAFLKKIWKKRRCEYPNRRRLMPVLGKQNEVDVTRAEGIILEDGDQLSAENMNNLEERIQAGFDESSVYKATFSLDGWQKSGSVWTQTVSCPGMKASYGTSAPWVYPTGVAATDDVLRQGLSILNSGKIETLDGQLKATIHTAPPKSDVQIYVRRAADAGNGVGTANKPNFTIESAETKLPRTNNQKETSTFTVAEDGVYSLYIQMADDVQLMNSNMGIGVSLNGKRVGGAGDTTSWLQMNLSFFAKKGDSVKIEFHKGTRSNNNQVYTTYTVQKVLFV